MVGGSEYVNDPLVWDPLPNPANYSSYTEPNKFYLLTIIDSKEEPVTNYSNIENFVKNNNNVALQTVIIENKPTVVREVDLAIFDNDADVGAEPNRTTTCFYNSPNIWVRNMDDGGLDNEKPEGGKTSMVYVKVVNRGKNASRGDERLFTYWTKAGTAVSWDESWTGKRFNQIGPLIGDYIGSLTIPSIPPGGSRILKFQWQVPSANNYIGYTPDAERWHFCLLARIVAESDPMTFTETTCTHTNVGLNNNIAQKNVTIVEPDGSGALGGVIAVGNIYAWKHPFCLKFLPESDPVSVSLCQKAEITIKLDNILYKAWQRGGAVSIGIQDIGNQTVLITNANASLCNMIFEPYEIGLLDLRLNFLTQKVTAQAKYTYHIVQTDALTGEVIGGEVYQITTSDRNLFCADAGEDIRAFAEEIVMLHAADIGEPALYRWYDPKGNLISEEQDIKIRASRDDKYKLEVIALSDGYKDYDEVCVTIVPGKIVSIIPNPASDKVTVSCMFNKETSAYIRVADATGMIYNYFELDASHQAVDFDISRYKIGSYVVTLFCNGVTVDSKVFLKK
jgi:hypothetical protein